MASGTPKGWDKDSDKLFIHESGVRIQRMAYKGKEGWFIVPVDLDQPVVEFEPTPEGRDKAFESFAKGAIPAKPKKKPVEKKPAKPAPLSDDDKEKDKDKDKDKDDDDEDDDEKEEK